MRVGNAILAGLLLSQSANAVMLRLRIAEDKNLPPAANVPGDLRIFNMYAEYDGPGGMTGPSRNNVLNQLDQINNTNGFGISLARNPGANFFQARVADGANNSFVGGPDLANPNLTSRGLHDTWLSMGMKYQDSSDKNGPYFQDASTPVTMTLVNSDGIVGPASLGLSAGQDFVRGDLTGGDAANHQGWAQPDGQGRFVSFIGQFAIAGLAPGVQIGEQTDVLQADIGWANHLAFQFPSDIFTGRMSIWSGYNTSEGYGMNINFVPRIPAPGGLMFAACGIVLMRRRRR